MGTGMRAAGRLSGWQRSHSCAGSCFPESLGWEKPPGHPASPRFAFSVCGPVGATLHPVNFNLASRSAAASPGGLPSSGAQWAGMVEHWTPPPPTSYWGPQVSRWTGPFPAVELVTQEPSAYGFMMSNPVRKCTEFQAHGRLLGLMLTFCWLRSSRLQEALPGF